MTETATTTPLVLTVDEAAKLLRISRNSAYAAIARGELPSVRVGKRILVPRAALEEILAGRKRGTDGDR